MDEKSVVPETAIACLSMRRRAIPTNEIVSSGDKMSAIPSSLLRPSAWYSSFERTKVLQPDAESKIERPVGLLKMEGVLRGEK